MLIVVFLAKVNLLGDVYIVGLYGEKNHIFFDGCRLACQYCPPDVEIDDDARVRLGAFLTENSRAVNSNITKYLRGNFGHRSYIEPPTRCPYLLARESDHPCKSQFCS